MRKHVLYLIAFIALHAMACSQKSANTITAAEFGQGIQQSGIQLLDVRTADEFKSGHIKNSLQADYNNSTEFESRTQHLDKSKPVYIYCLSGVRSKYALDFLQTKGFTKIYHLKGGINAWKQAGMAVEGGKEEAQITMQDYQNLVSKDSLVLVDFGADWCPPCKKMEPLVDALLKANPSIKLVKVDGGTQLNVMQQLKVEALPVFIIYKNGKQVWRRDGIATLAELQKQID
jgi:rhodanese-related sulfurtransferase/glutaredoxin